MIKVKAFFICKYRADCLWFYNRFMWNCFTCFHFIILLLSRISFKQVWALKGISTIWLLTIHFLQQFSSARLMRLKIIYTLYMIPKSCKNLMIDILVHWDLKKSPLCQLQSNKVTNRCVWVMNNIRVFISRVFLHSILI